MRKIYSLALLAAALLISANGWAANVAKIGTQEYATLQDAIAAVSDSEQTTITLLSEAEISSTIYLHGSKNIVVDMNGQKITASSYGTLGSGLFDIDNVSLEFIGDGEINTEAVNQYWTMFVLHGSANPSTTERTYLHFGKDVKCIGSIGEPSIAGNYGVNMIGIPQENRAYGIEILVENYIKAYAPMATNGVSQCSEGEKVPYIHITKNAELTTGQGSGVKYAIDGDVANGIYAAGYAKWLIEGTVMGPVGIYVKSGDFHITGDAKIIGLGEYKAPSENGSGSSGNGDALVYDSHSSYGPLKLVIDGDPIFSSEAGFGFHEVATKGDSKIGPSDVDIKGGTFKGGNGETGGAINTTAEAENIIIADGAIKGGNFNDETIKKYVENVDGVITVVKGDDGKDRYVVSDTKDAIWEPTLAGATKDTYVKLDGATETVATDLEIAYLKVLNNSTVTVEKSLTVGGVILDENSKLIVKAGAKLIVLTQGIVAFNENNIVLETQEGKEAILLLSPDVTGNTHPYATVDFISKSITDGSKYIKQRFGIPTNSQLTEVLAKQEENDIQTAFSAYDYVQDKWVDFGFINVSGQSMDYARLSNPFEYYQMQNNTKTAGTVITFKGQLIGIANPELVIRANSWNGYANSYTGNMKIEKLIAALPSTVDAAIYVNSIDENQSVFDAVSDVNIDMYDVVAPLQPFLVRNPGIESVLNIKYADIVYAPATSKASQAPRRALKDMTRVRINVTGEEGTDRVVLAEGDQFTPEFDNGYDAVKYMNETMNVYVSAEEDMAIYATNYLANTYISFESKQGGDYTISFDHVSGVNYILKDLETGTQVEMKEGNTYSFTIEANAVASNRFKVIPRAEAPTAVDNVTISTKTAGIYTVCGQYVGEMNIWNTLPAGIYIVNGEKVAK